MEGGWYKPTRGFPDLIVLRDVDHELSELEPLKQAVPAADLAFIDSSKEELEQTTMQTA
jgi:hypothetical protein